MATISFDNTENAFAYKSEKDLKKAKFLFSTMGYPFFVPLGTRITPLLIKGKLPFINSIVRNTIFKQFVGGESLEETKTIGDILGNYGVQVILDYGVEGKEGEANFDIATDEFIRVIEYAATQKNIPFISVKVTGIARFELLASLDEAPRLRSGIHDHEAEIGEWERVKDRMYAICAFLGFSTGFWAIFVTMGAEQFGTNLRATAATTIPNVVRGALPLINLMFLDLFQGVFKWNLWQSGVITGLIVLVVTFIAFYFTEETFHKDLDYLEVEEMYP